MKKLLPFIIAFIFSLTIKGQSPALTYTNLTGSDTITCSHAGINYIASVSNYTSGSLTYTWISASTSTTGTNVTLTNGGAYTLTAFNTANSFSLSQTFIINTNTVAPTSSVTPITQNITCVAGSIATFTGVTTSTLANVTQSYLSPFSTGAAISNGTISIYSTTGPGTYTYCVTNNINGCSTCKTITVTSTSGFPTYTITSPTQFTVGCNTTSLTTIGISNVFTNPTPGPVSYTVLPPTYTGPTYTVGGTSVYTVNASGQYTVIVHDNSNGCETKIPVSVISNTTPPQITASATNPILTCNVPNTLLQGTSTNTNVSFNWASPGPLVSPHDTITVLTTANATNTFVGTYTLTVTNTITTCNNTQTLNIYQNTALPTAVITGSNTVACSSTIILTNSSTSNVSPVFFPTLPVIGYEWFGPVPQPSVSNTSIYQAYTPGTYTLVALDLNNGCKATATKTITGTGTYPQVSSVPFSINCPAPTISIYPYVTGVVTGLTYSWTAPSNATVSALNTPTITTNAAGVYTVIVTTPAGCSTSTLVTVTTCSGLKQNVVDNNAIHIYPNPTNGIFTIEATDVKENTVLEIYSSIGALVKKQVGVLGKNELNIEKEGAGLYFILIMEGEKAIKTAKIVKQ